MKKQKLLGAILAVIAIATIGVFAYQRWGNASNALHNELLLQMPADASAVFYIDLNALKQSPFIAELYKWTPQPTADADYAQFLQATGFDYEKDLNRVSIAILKRAADSTLFAVAEGKFDRKKITAYALQTGTRESRNGRETFSVPINGSGGARKIVFTFLRNDRIALTNGSDLESSLSTTHSNSDAQAWVERFRRLAGSPVFAVIRQDAGAGAALSSRATVGLQSPQLSALVDQLQWITIAGKPEAEHLRIVLEGEGGPDVPTRQLSEVINGLLLVAQAGLHDKKMREQLPPDSREAYLELLKSADVSQIDRGETKSVRLMFDITPKFLEAARTAMPVAPPVIPQNKTLQNKGTIRN